MARMLPKIGNREKALIHVAKTRLSLSEEAYRDMLRSVGVASSKDLDPLQFDELMRRFESCGFARKAEPVKRKRRPKPADSKASLIKKIDALLADSGLPRSYADAMAQRMFGVGAVDWCTPTQLWKIVAALSIYRNRRKRPKGGKE